MSGGPQYMQGVMNSTHPSSQSPTQSSQDPSSDGSPTATSQVVPTSAPAPPPTFQTDKEAASNALQNDLEVGINGFLFRSNPNQFQEIFNAAPPQPAQPFGDAPQRQAAGMTSSGGAGVGGLSIGGEQASAPGGQVPGAGAQGDATGLV